MFESSKTQEGLLNFELSNSELPKELAEIWFKVVKRYPVLGGVEIVIPSKDDVLKYGFTGGEFLVPNEEFPDPGIVIDIGNDEAYEELAIKRPLAVSMNAKLLGLKKEEMTGRIIRTFIFLHEVGHAFDYLTNFEQNPDIGSENARAVWELQFASQLETMPIPNFDPTDLRSAIINAGGFEHFLKVRSELVLVIKELGANNAEDLLKIQDSAYRKLQKESFADNFAAKIMKEEEIVKK